MSSSTASSGSSSSSTSSTSSVSSIDPGKDVDYLNQLSQNCPNDFRPGRFTAIEMLSRLFPEQKRTILELVLQGCNGDVSKAIEHFISLNDAMMLHTGNRSAQLISSEAYKHRAAVAAAAAAMITGNGTNGDSLSVSNSNVPSSLLNGQIKSAFTPIHTSLNFIHPNGYLGSAISSSVESGNGNGSLLSSAALCPGRPIGSALINSIYNRDFLCPPGVNNGSGNQNNSSSNCSTLASNSHAYHFLLGSHHPFTIPSVPGLMSPCPPGCTQCPQPSAAAVAAAAASLLRRPVSPNRIFKESLGSRLNDVSSKTAIDLTSLETNGWRSSPPSTALREGKCSNS